MMPRWAHGRAAIALVAIACDPSPDPPSTPPPELETQQHWQELAECLVGDPLAADELASDRMRRIDLWIFANFSIPEGLEGWPRSCSPYAGALFAVVERLAKEPGGARYEPLRRVLGKITRAPSASVYEERGAQGRVVDGLFAAAGVLGLVHRSSPGKTKPTSAPLSVRELKRLGAYDEEGDGTHIVVNDSAHVVVQGLRCDFHSDKRAIDRVDCAPGTAPPPFLPPLPPALSALGGTGNRMTTCRSGTITTVALHTRLGDDPPLSAKVSVAVVFHDGDDWHGPVETTIEPRHGGWGRGPARYRGPFEPRLDCHGKEATLTWAREGNRVAQLRCTPGGCKSQASGAFPLIGSLERMLLADLRGQVLVVWVVANPTRLTGHTAALMFKLAPIDTIAKGGWRVILGDRGGWIPVKGLDALVVDDAAAILVRGGQFVYGVRIAADGGFTPYAPAWFRGSSKSELGPRVPEGASFHALSELEQGGIAVERLDENEWLLCNPQRDTCLCLEPLACRERGDCITLEENLRVFRKELAKSADRQVICERAETGHCGDFRYFLFEGGIHRYELRWFDAAGKLVGQRNTTDYPEYCGGQALASYRGYVPKCEKVVSDELLCGEAKRPLSTPLEDFRARLLSPLANP
jgi:hypothetical protein